LSRRGRREKRANLSGDDFQVLLDIEKARRMEECEQTRKKLVIWLKRE
jgi:hypothetical protein